jgi:DNA-binding transcriptional ArsR family regulator
MGDPARANMLAALMDGRALTATELGIAGGIAPSTASGHLSKLLDGNLVSVSSSGRHRYFRLASPAVAQALETLMTLSGDGPPRYRPKSRADEEMMRARTCYDHLAGMLGVAIADSLAAHRQVILSDEGGLVTDAGRSFLGTFGVQVDSVKGRRALCRACVDWTERRWHIGGALGAAIANRCFELGWTKRQRDSRALIVTRAGEQAFEKLFGVRI